MMRDLTEFVFLFLMSVILHIETATEVCSVSLANEGKVIAVKETSEEKSHASTLSVFIEELLRNAEKKNLMPHAIAVSMGPGSYTGLRIGVSIAKGLCYGYGIPLISVSTLEAMSIGFQEEYVDKKNAMPNKVLYAPMIDARRMEVYMALFTPGNRKFKDIVAQIVEPDTFNEVLSDHKIYFFGSGAEKLKGTITNKNAYFVDDFSHSSVYMTSIAYAKYKAEDFVDLAYFEPFYLKDFIPTTSKNTIFSASKKS